MSEDAPSPAPAADADGDAFKRALALLQAGEAPAAEGLLVDLLQRQPQHAGALHLLGIVRAQQGELDTAIGLFQQALALRPLDAIAHHNLGNALALQYRREEALASLNRSLELQPANADALITRAKMQMELQQPIEALRSLDQALALRPHTPEALMYRGDVLALLSELGMSRREDAVQAYRESLALSEFRFDYAYVLPDRGHETIYATFSALLDGEPSTLNISVEKKADGRWRREHAIEPGSVPSTGYSGL